MLRKNELEQLEFGKDVDSLPGKTNNKETDKNSNLTSESTVNFPLYLKDRHTSPVII